MPLIKITIAGQSPNAAQTRQLQAETTRLMHDILGKKAALTVVSVSCLPASALSAAGQALADGGAVVATAAYLEAFITAGTNSAGEKAAFIAAAHAMLCAVLGQPAAPVYIIIHDQPASDWGYDGQTQAARSLAAQAL